MRRRNRKLSLNRDTLLRLETLDNVAGGFTATNCPLPRCQSLVYACTNTCTTGDTTPTLLQTCNVCSNTCQTGGACTV